MKDIFLLIEENKETQEGFIRGQTTDEQKGLDWRKTTSKNQDHLSQLKQDSRQKVKRSMWFGKKI